MQGPVIPNLRYLLGGVGLRVRLQNLRRYTWTGFGLRVETAGAPADPIVAPPVTRPRGERCRTSPLRRPMPVVPPMPVGGQSLDLQSYLRRYTH